MPSITQPLSRRTFLRGVGVTMALPWLESVPVWGDDKPKNTSSEPPVRFAALFSGNGFHSKEWWARGEGKDMQVGDQLRSDDRGEDEGPDEGAEPCARYRGIDCGDPQELLDDLQLPHFVEQ